MLVYKRLYDILEKRLSSAKKKSDKIPEDPCASKRYSEAAQDLYAYVRLMELCETLSKDVSDMKRVLDLMSESVTPLDRPN